MPSFFQAQQKSSTAFQSQPPTIDRSLTIHLQARSLIELGHDYLLNLEDLPAPTVEVWRDLV
jgi:hypothetical protein